MDSAPVFLEQGTINVSGTDSLYKAKFTGTKSNEEYTLYKIAVQPLNDAVKALNAEYASAPAEKQASPEFRNYLLNKQNALQQQAKDINKKFIAENPASYISLQTLIDAVNSEAYPDAANLQAQFSALSKGLRESMAGVAYQKRLDAMKSVSVGAIAPDFAEPDTSGVPIKLSSFKGKYVFLDFWASWCGPCRNENPNVVKAYNKYKGENFTILSVSLDQTGKKSDWLKAIHDDGLTWNHVSDLKFWANDAALLYSVRAIPQNFLIDPSGKIIARNIFGDDLQKKLAEIFNKM
jgi:peroxiredoxin